MGPSENSTTNEVPTPSRVGFGAIARYASGDFAFNLYWQSITLFLLYYYTDVVGLSPQAAGLLYLIGSIWDAAIDPVVGIVADRWHARVGSYRGWLTIGSPILGLSFVFLYFHPPLQGTSLFLVALASHLIFRTCYAAVNIPYSAMTARLTGDAAERSQISGMRMVFATLGGVAVALLTQPLARAAGGQNGFCVAALALAVVGSLIIPVLAARSEGKTPGTEREPSSSLKAAWKAVLRNRAFWTLIVGVACAIAGATAIGKAVIYYFKYYLQDEAGAKTALAAIGASGLVIVPCLMMLARLIGKRGVWLLCCLVGLVGLGSFWLLDVRTPLRTIALLTVIHVGTLGAGFGFWSMLPDTVEYGEWRTGVRTEAFIFGLAAFFLKIALGVGTGLFSLALGLIGYTANQAQSAQTLLGLKAIIVVLPFTGFVLAALAVLFSPLKGGAHERIVAELAGRRDAAGPLIRPQQSQPC